MRLSMSEENVEVVRRGMDLWLGGDFDGWLTTIDPDVGWDISTHPSPTFRTTVGGGMRS
jgi:ketosteroid isomerase-like protein